MALMTQAQFVDYAYQVLSIEALEPLFERIAEHNSEVAAFGDSGPGTQCRIYESVHAVMGVERQLARIEGRAVRSFGFRVSSPQ